ncbi:nucleotidyltransferase family protein [Spirosoma soli]|uniref:Nucleotidyltransferase family protein n=1 Tax=Spirosoma soli TaxID=1770529 RepID=A0ABW5M0I6_9BACT
MQSITPIVTEFKHKLRQLYGDQLAELVLFGSYARGDSHDESDVDFAVVLENSDISSTDEVVRLVPISTALSLKYGVVVSILPVSKQKLSTSMQGVYQEIRREGIRL